MKAYIKVVAPLFLVDVMTLLIFLGFLTLVRGALLGL